MDPKGNIYEDSEEKPVTPEDKARLEGFLKARAEVDAETRIKERLSNLESKLNENV